MKKRCLICGLNKDFNEFNQMKSSKDGKQVYCRICMKVVSKKLKIKNSDSIRKIRSKYKKDRMKRCPTCGLYKNPEEFHRDKRAKNGWRSQCKSCKSPWTKEYRRTHKAEEKKALKLWQKNNPDKVRKQKKRHKKRCMEELRDGYVRKTIREKYKTPSELINEEMINRERAMVKINRTVREIRKNGKSKADRRGNVESSPDEELRSLFSLLS